MTIQLDLPDTVPMGAWLTAGAVAWYMLAGALLRTVCRKPKNSEEAIEFSLIWLTTPLWLSAVIAACVASVVLWPISCGVVRPFWQWSIVRS